MLEFQFQDAHPDRDAITDPQWAAPAPRMSLRAKVAVIFASAALAWLLLVALLLAMWTLVDLLIG
jgi:hypothetical protein